MANKTSNYNLIKPTDNETADINVLNSNFDIIDTKIKENKDHANNAMKDIGDTSNLKTKDKSNLVGAINEVNASMSAKANQTGNTKTIDFVQKDNGDSGISKTIDWTQSNKQNIVITDNTTLTFTPPTNACNLVLVITYTGTYTVTLPTHKTVGGDSLEFTKASGKTDILSLYFDGTTYYCMLSADWQ